MTKEQWQEAWRLYEAVQEMPDEDREGFLNSATADRAVLERIYQLLSDESPKPTLSESFALEEPPPPSVKIGDKIGRYVVVSSIGRGGMGEVFAANDTELHRQVAMKFLSSDQIGDPAAVSRFIREARSVSALNHPNIVTLHEVIQTDTQLAIVMELVEGTSLRKMMGKPLPLDQLIHVGQQTAEALAAAHAKGIMHRDIKPENLMLRRDGYVKVLDFGLARNISSEAEANRSASFGLAAGTLRYMSPEQARAEPPTQASDIFALGIVLYELATGQHPFPASSPFATLQAITSDKPATPSLLNQFIPWQMESLILSMLEKFPAARPSAREVSQALADCRSAKSAASTKGRTDTLKLPAKKIGDTDPITGEVLPAGPVASPLRLESDPAFPAMGAAAATAPARDETPVPPAATHRASASVWSGNRAVWIVAALCVAVTGGLAWRYFGAKTPTVDDPGGFQSNPLTSQTGSETVPVFTADGQRLAFLWTRHPDEPAQIYTMRPGVDSPAKLTSFPDSPAFLTWSPAGDRIAFVRGKAGRDNVFALDLDPATGEARSPQNPAALLELNPGCKAAGLDWSPDGKKLALADCAPGMTLRSIYTFELATGEKRKVTFPSGVSSEDTHPVFSPDGNNIAFRRSVTNAVDDVFVVGAGGGTPKAVTQQAGRVDGISWTPRGDALIVSSLRSGGVFALWRFPLTGDQPARRITQMGLHAVTPTVSRRGNRVAWVNLMLDLNIWRIPVTGAGTPEQFLSSTQRDQDPHVAEDGRIAFRSDRSGTSEIWIANANASSAVRVSHMNGALTGSPRWSPDGKWLAFDSRPDGNPDLYVVPCEPGLLKCGEVRRLTSRIGSDVIPSWTAASDALYYCSEQSGRREVWKLPVDSRNGEGASQVTRNSGYVARESRDGKWLYFSKLGGEAQGIWRIPGSKASKPLDATAEEFLIPLADENSTATWAQSGDEIFYSMMEKVASGARVVTIRAFHVATRKTRVVLTSGEKPIDRGLAVTPDGKWLLYSQLDSFGSNIVWAEGVR